MFPAQIQQCYRGHLGRRRFDRAVLLRNRGRRAAFFAAAATEVQRRFRGFWSRKHVHSMAARRAFLESSLAASAELRTQAEAALAAQTQALAADSDAQMMVAIERALERLHHLTGTACVPGVLASPYGGAVSLPAGGGLAGPGFELQLKTVARFSASLALGYKHFVEPPPLAPGETAHRTPVEERAMATLRPQGRATVFRTINKLSMQASCPYDAVQAAERAERTRHKLSTTGVRDFATTIKSARGLLPCERGPSMLISEPYAEPRGLHAPSRAGGRAAPFRTAVGGAGGKTAALLEDYHLPEFHAPAKAARAPARPRPIPQRAAAAGSAEETIEPIA